MTVVDWIRERGPVTVAAFIERALHDPQHGYYARAPRRSGRAGDFFTSVDVGPLFGELLELQLAEMESLLDSRASSPAFDLVEAGAGNGRLSADILRAARLRHPSLYPRIALHLVERSAAARAQHADVLKDAEERVASSAPDLPSTFEGVLIANELLDAMPVHQVVMREDGLREVYVAACGGRERTQRAPQPTSGLTVIEGPPSTRRLAEYLDDVGVVLEPGWRAEINLCAVDWIADAARRLRRGFIIVIDYGHEASELYSVTHAGGTLTTFSRHAMSGPEDGRGVAPWLLDGPGDHDITAHVDFTGVRAAAEREGLTTLAFSDQTHFLMGIVEYASRNANAASSADSIGNERLDLGGPHTARQLKTLIMPGGLGSTHNVMVFGKGVGKPDLLGGSCRNRLT